MTTTAIKRAHAFLGRNQARSLYACQQPGATFNLWEGSVRAGKTYVSIFAFLVFVADLPDDRPMGGQLVITGKNLGSIYRNFFRTIEDSPGLSAFKGAIDYKQGASVAHIFGREVQVVGTNDARAESKIRGMTILAVYVDEATVMLEETFKQLLARMSLAESKMFATTNPDSPAHWLKTDYIDQLRVLADWRRFHFVMEDNPSTSADVRRRLGAQYTGLWHKRFIQGLWVAAEGAIFDMWDTAKHVMPWELLPKMRRLIGVGMDFGTSNPSTGLILGQSLEKVGHQYRSRLYLVDEWKHTKASTSGTLSPSQQAGLFKEWLGQPPLPYETPLTPEHIIVDPAALHFAKELNLAGIPTSSGLNKVQWGISLMASLLSEQKLVVSSMCPGFIAEAPGYAWDPKSAAKGVDEPVKVADHSLDGARYILATTEELWRPDVNWALAA